MIKHTKGPWEVDRTFKGNPMVKVFRDSRVIVSEIDSRGPDEDEANAALIAAAPDMLAHLKNDLAECQLPECPGCEKVKALIAKAEGA